MVTALFNSNTPVEVLDAEHNTALIKTMNQEPMQLMWVGGSGWTLVDWRYTDRNELTAICTGLEESDEYQNWIAACQDVDFLADDRRPETAAAMAREEQARARLMDYMHKAQEVKRD